jgi:hypothetical protein
MSKKIPKKLIAIPNADKAFHEKWKPGRDMLDIPHPYRGVVLGPPNSGKSTVCKNILLRARPPFIKVHIIHCDGGYTQEYKDLGDNVIMETEIPAPSDWKGDQKTLVIIDDLAFKQMNKTQLHNVGRLFGYVSTHKNISVLLCQQDPFDVPVIVRRCSNLWVLYRMDDLDALSTVARKTGLSRANYRELFDLCRGPHDSIWIDKTAHSPAPLRLNGYQRIQTNALNKNG